MSYRTERISTSNFSAFVEIIKASFIEQAIDEPYFRRKFDTAYTGHSWLGYLAFDQETNEPAAYYGVYPTIVSKDGQEYVAAQSGDTATHPKHRGKGLFRLLHDLTMELCRNEGIAFIFGFPNQNSYPGFKKFNWSDRVFAETLMRLVKVPLALRACRKLLPGPFRRYQERIIRRTGTSDLAAVETAHSLMVGSGQPIIIPRSRSYLGYKLALGSELLKLKSGVAWVGFRGNRIVIGDLFGSDHRKMVHELRAFAARTGYDVLILTTSSARLCTLFIEQDGFSRHNSNKLIINCLGRVISDMDFAFTSGDHDVFGYK